MKTIYYMNEGILILFGGGDGGGIRITSHGIVRVPGNNPEVRAQLQEVAAILETAGSLVAGAQHITDEGLQQRLDSVAVDMFQLAGKSVEAIFANEGAVR
ncbi:MAG TPA: hypothetical protein VJ761_03195 [Ktedonobacteraceae bacterium]|nr:hypothetical protein [Ktedonobacteraceae bacterium]